MWIVRFISWDNCIGMLETQRDTEITFLLCRKLIPSTNWASVRCQYINNQSRTKYSNTFNVWSSIELLLRCYISLKWMQITSKEKVFKYIVESNVQWCTLGLHRFLHDLQIWTFSSWWRPVVKGNEREVLIVLVRLGDVDGPAVILSPESCPSAQHLLSGHHSPHRDKQHTLVLTFLWERERERERCELFLFHWYGASRWVGGSLAATGYVSPIVYTAQTEAA